MGPCVPPDELSAFNLGDLPEPRLEQVAEHLEACPRCAATAQALDGVSDRFLQDMRAAGARGGPVEPDGPAPAGAVLPRRVGAYEILGELGRGGMGVVYRARHGQLGRVVALKMLLGGAFEAATHRDRFLWEAEAVARLQHPHIVQLYEAGEHHTEAGERYPYFTLELVEGGSLADRLADRPVPPRQAAAWLERIGRAVHYAHERGLVHRDLKPSNILLTADGQPKLCDFGIAKALEGDGVHTRSGLLVGTPDYMAPEQLDGSGRVGPLVDVYALGAVLYALLVGRPPFRTAGAAETLALVARGDPEPPRRWQPSVPTDLETICLKCLHPAPGGRYGSAAEVADDLRRFLDGEPIRARPTPAWERAWKGVKRRPLVAALAAGVVLVTALALVLVTWQWRRAEDKAAEARQAGDEAEARRKRAEEAEARLALWQGQALCEQGEVGRGLLWLARGLERAASAGASELDRPLRVNLAEWGRRLPRREARLPNPGWVRALTFDPAGRLLLAGGTDGQVHFWDVATGREVGPALAAPRFGPEAWVTRVAFSPDGRRIATSSQKAVVLWDAASRKPDGAPLPHDGLVWGLAFLPDGRLATCVDDGTVRVWDLAARRVVLGPLRHCGAPNYYYTLAAYPKGPILASAGQDGRVVFWDTASGHPAGPGLTHGSCVIQAAFTADGEKLLTTTRGGTVHVWALKTGRATDLPFQGFEANALALSPDGRRFATGTGFGIVRLWHTDSLRPAGPVYRQRASVQSLAFSPDGRRLVIGTENDGLHVVELPPPAEAAPPARLAAEVHAVGYFRDGARLLAGTQGGAARMEPATGRLLGPLLSNPEDYRVDGTALSPDGRTLTMGRWSGEAGAWRGRAELWDVVTGTRRWQTPDLLAIINVVAYSPDGRRVFCCGGGVAPGPGGAALWDAAGGERLHPLLRSLPQGVGVSQAAFHPAGRVLLLACSDGRARLWDVEADAEVEPDRPLVHAAPVTACAFDADGGRVLTGCRDGTAHLWDARDRRELGEPLRHEAEVSAVAFSPDGRALLTGSLDGSARFWDAGSGKPLGPPLWHADGVLAVAFHPDGSRAATGGKDATVRQWPTPAAPLEGDPGRVRLWAEALSGMELDAQGAVHALTAEALGELRRLLEAGEGPDSR
jgi:WD40 repeat protein